MTPLPRSRYALYVVLALAAAGTDLYSKHVVFRDLGYPASSENRPHVPDRPGDHEQFEPARDLAGNVIEGVSEAYLDGWVAFRLYTSFNEGALWGVGQGGSWVFAALSVIAIVGVIYWLFLHGAAASAWLTVALALVSGGALGNLYDRLGGHGCVNIATGEIRHAVRDFLLFSFGGWHWPVFNFADVFLVTGAVMLVLQSLLMPDPHPSEEPLPSEASEPATTTK
ncbi:MAG: signal peptidase II [Planctomycetaceae bacterium]